MAGIGDTRGTETRMCFDVCMQSLKKHFQTMKEIVMVCPANEMTKIGFSGLIRETFTKVGLMLEGIPNEMIPPLKLVATKNTSRAPDAVLNTLKNILKSEEFQSKTEDDPIKRVLLLLTQSVDPVFYVDATKPEQVARFTGHLSAIPNERHVSMTSLKTSHLSSDFKRMKSVINIILAAKEELQNEIKMMQFALANQLLPPIIK